MVKIGIRKVFRQACQQGGAEGGTVDRDASRVGRLVCWDVGDVAIVGRTDVVDSFIDSETE